MKKIRIAIVGVGNCASALAQGIEYYRKKNSAESNGLMHWKIGEYAPGDIEITAAFDIDKRKVGKNLASAIITQPNCTPVFQKVPRTKTVVSMGRILDGVAEHMREGSGRDNFILSTKKESSAEDLIRILRSSGAEIFLNYLPVGSVEATRFYAECALRVPMAFINCMPVFIASDPFWSKRFLEAGCPIIGDDIKAQLGATILHRTLMQLFQDRGVLPQRTYQLNFGGNTDFRNMLDRSRLELKKQSKTEAVQSILTKRFDSENIHIGPSDYVPWLKDEKVCSLRVEGVGFGGQLVEVEVRLKVIDSPNSAGVAIDAIRCAKLALDRGIGGVLDGPSAYFMKHPPQQYTDEEARRKVQSFIL